MDHHQDHGDYNAPAKKTGKMHNVLPLWGNEATMNLNPLILANIQSSSYFKVHLFKLKTYHEVVDEIYYQVKHLEPWERGSRKTAGQTGMCGGVRGVGAGGIVSTAYCLLYKLYTLRLTRKQLNGLLTHSDSPYIRALGFMYIRYTQPPADLYDWYEEYLLDDEEVDAKAGGGAPSTNIGQMLHQFLVKLDWFSTLFPRIPVPIQKQIEKKLAEFSQRNNVNMQARFANAEREQNAANHAAAAAAAAAAASHHGVGGGGGGGGGIGKAGGSGRYQQHQQPTAYNNSSSGSGSRSYERDRDSNRRYRSRSRERSSRSNDDRYNANDRESSSRRPHESSSSSSSSYQRRGGAGGGGGGGSGNERSKHYYRNEHEDRDSSSERYSTGHRDRKYR